jgi:hypothetical protein
MPAYQMPGVVEQAMGEVVGGAQFAEARLISE